MQLLNLTWRPRPVFIGGTFPLRRVLVVLAAPLALLILGDVPLPLVNEYEFKHVLKQSDMSQVSVIALGVMPVLSSFALVELIALAVPRLRWRRHDPLGRVRLNQAAAALAIIIALVQGYFVATYLEAASAGGAELVSEPGLKFRLLVMVSLAGGTMILAVVAGMISVHGLGNGYGVMIVTGWLVSIFWRIYDKPNDWIDRSHLLGLVFFAAMCLLARALFRARVESHEREAAMCLPSSSIAPLSDIGGLAYLVFLLAALGLGDKLTHALDLIGKLRANNILAFVLVLAFVPIWSWLLARPAVIERVAKAANLTPPTRETWLRATIASAVVLGALFLLQLLATRMSAARIGDAVMALIATAVALDIFDDARAHREPLAIAGVLHQIQRTGVVERVLGDAKIRCHIHASNLRALYAFFAPWAPAIVLVPTADAEVARKKLDEVLREPRAPLAPARVKIA